MVQWQLRETKNRLGALADSVISGEPQKATRRGKPTAAIIASEDHERLRRLEKARLPTLKDLLLEMPQDDGEFERLSMPTRHFEP